MTKFNIKQTIYNTLIRICHTLLILLSIQPRDKNCQQKHSTDQKHSLIKQLLQKEYLGYSWLKHLKSMEETLERQVVCWCLLSGIFSVYSLVRKQRMLEPGFDKFILLYSSTLAFIAWIICIVLSISFIVKAEFKSPDNFFSTIFNAQRAELYMERKDKILYRLSVLGVVVFFPPASYMLILLLKYAF